MKSIDPSLRNASVLLAGGACLVPILARVPQVVPLAGGYRLIQLLVQPITVYLMIVIWRLAVKLFKGLRQEYPSWKDVFKV